MPADFKNLEAPFLKFVTRHRIPLILGGVTVFLIVHYYGQEIFFKQLVSKDVSFRKKVNCITAPANGNQEGLGAFIRRYQIVFFLAASNDIPIAFQSPNQSQHGYITANFFGTCPGGTIKTEPGCSFNEWHLNFNRCPRSDCDCMRRDMDRVFGQAERNCERINFVPAPTFHTEYSGCIRPVLMKYLGNEHPPPFEYDAIHYRQGDLKHVQNALAWSEEEVHYIIMAMCRLSKRPIVIVTQGAPKVSHCGNPDRRILAADLSILESFRILQYAKNIAVGQSSFALAMMELANPERLIVLDNAASHYEWVNTENWTVIANRGMMYNFESKELMAKTVISDESIWPRTSSEVKKFPPPWYAASVPKRLWANEGA